MPGYPTETMLYTIQPYDTLWNIAQRFNTTVYEIMAANPGMTPNFLRVGQIISIHPGNPGMGCYPKAGFQCPDMVQSAMCFNRRQVGLMNEMRRLWVEHAIWTWSAILGIVESLPETDAIVNRLLRNPTDFGAALRPLYGEERASTFATLLRDHLVIAADLVKAAKAGNTNAAAEAERKWYENADDIAAFLGSINPFWSAEEWREMLHEHLRLVKEQAVQLLAKNYPAAIAAFDQNEAHVLAMGDMLADGIMKQFPRMFAG